VTGRNMAASARPASNGDDDPADGDNGHQVLRPRSFLFTLFGDYVHPVGEDSVRVGALVRLAGELGISDNALRSALTRLGREGWLQPERGRGFRGYSLTPETRQLIEEGIRRIYGSHRAGWDGRWLLVSYSVPEQSRELRDRLRQSLSFLGLGALGNGLFVSPHDLHEEVLEAVRRCQVEEHVTMHLGRLTWPEDPAQVVARAWDLERLSSRWAAFLERWSPASEPASDQESFRCRFLLTHEFRHLLYDDPDLPEPLLPADWIGTWARERFLGENRRLRHRAERHYLEVAGV
jgi:phenylacetic acid degradation operon negative regulatory protein